MNMRKILVGWNRVYGCQPFEVNIPYNCKIEEVKECKEKECPGYMYWIEEIPESMDFFDYLKERDEF